MVDKQNATITLGLDHADVWIQQAVDISAPGGFGIYNGVACDNLRATVFPDGQPTVLAGAIYHFLYYDLLTRYGLFGVKPKPGGAWTDPFGTLNHRVTYYLCVDLVDPDPRPGCLIRVADSVPPPDGGLARARYYRNLLAKSA